MTLIGGLRARRFGIVTAPTAPDVPPPWLEAFLAERFGPEWQTIRAAAIARDCGIKLLPPDLQEQVDACFDAAAIATIAAAIGVQADERLAFELRYAVSFYVGQHPPEGRQRIKWRLVRKYVERVRDRPETIHRLWPRRGRANESPAEWHARQRAHSLVLHATEPDRPADVPTGPWSPRSIISPKVRENLLTWPPPDGTTTLTPRAREEITAAATRALVEIPKWGDEAKRLRARTKLSTRTLTAQGLVLAPGPPKDHFGFRALVDELAAIYEERTGTDATVSYNDIGDDCPRYERSPFVKFVAAVLTRLALLGPAYERYGPGADLSEQARRDVCLARQLQRVMRRDRCTSCHEHYVDRRAEAATLCHACTTAIAPGRNS